MISTLSQPLTPHLLQSKKETIDRKRSILYLISSYLRENNFTTTADSLESEAQLSNDFEVCDNIDLENILQEYSSYYHAKFNKSPKIIKQSRGQRLASMPPPPPKDAKKKSCFAIPSKLSPSEVVKNQEPEDFAFDIRRLLPKKISEEPSPLLAQRNLKPLCDFEGYSSDWREMAEIILKEVVPNNLGIKFSDCIGLENSIELLKEAVIYPPLYPCIFSGLFSPWNGILLYGPPGTGKTLLSRAVACECQTIFFNLTSSTFIHKWRGDSEKMLKVLFDLAKFYSPSTIFIDELDSIASGGADFQHDATRRFKSELLIHLDGILKDHRDIFILATTNKPWDLDSAILRRFDKRILVDLPNEENRSHMFKYYFSSNRSIHFGNDDFLEMARATPNFSGSDIKVACREAYMRKFREEIGRLKGNSRADILVVPPPNLKDVLGAVGGVRPVTNSSLQDKYLKWHADFGCL